MSFEQEKSKRQNGVHISPQIATMARKMLKEGATLEKVSDTLNISVSTVKRIKKMIQSIQQKSDIDWDFDPDADPEKERWLRKNWNWVIPKKTKKEKTVSVGYKSNFRTPYRPDGIWR